MGKYTAENGQVPLRVLLVERDGDVLALLSTLLEHNGHDVRTASSFKEALTLAEDFAPEAVYTSIVLLVGSGFELVKHLRTLPNGSNTVIVALTGHVTSMTSSEWHDAGFDHVLRKPANIDHIVDVLKQISIKRNSHLRLV